MLSEMRSKDLIDLKEGYRVSSFRHAMPGLVIAVHPDRGGWSVEFLGSDGQVHRKPRRWFKVIKEHSENGDET